MLSLSKYEPIHSQALLARGAALDAFVQPLGLERHRLGLLGKTAGIALDFGDVILDLAKALHRCPLVGEGLLDARTPGVRRLAAQDDCLRGSGQKKEKSRKRHEEHIVSYRESTTGRVVAPHHISNGAQRESGNAKHRDGTSQFPGALAYPSGGHRRREDEP